MSELNEIIQAIKQREVYEPEINDINLNLPPVINTLFYESKFLLNELNMHAHARIILAICSKYLDYFHLEAEYDPFEISTFLRYVLTIVKQFHLIPHYQYYLVNTFAEKIYNLSNFSLNILGLQDKNIYIAKALADILTSFNYENLTKYHIVTVKLLIQTKLYHYALPLCNVPLKETESESSIKLVDYLEYHFLSSIVYTQLDKFQEALESVEKIVILPEHFTRGEQFRHNTFLTNAIKRYLLLFNLFKDEFSPIQLSIIKTNLKQVQKLLKLYFDLGSYISKGSISMLEGTIDKNNSLLTKEKTDILAKKCLSILKEKNLINLANIYCFAKFQDIKQVIYQASNYDNVPVESLLLDLIFKDKLSCKITEKQLDSNTGKVTDGNIEFEENLSEFKLCEAQFDDWDNVQDGIDKVEKLRQINIELQHKLMLSFAKGIEDETEAFKKTSSIPSEMEEMEYFSHLQYSDY